MKSTLGRIGSLGKRPGETIRSYHRLILGNQHLHLQHLSQFNVGLHPFNISNTINLVRSYSTKLAEVGRFEERLTDDNYYPAGQLFLHRIFGYRGVILFPWLARVHDVDLRKQYSSTSGTLKNESHTTDDRDQFNSSAAHQSRTSTSSTSSSTADEPSCADSTSEEPKLSFKSVKNNTNKERYSSSQTNRYHPYYQVLIDTRDCQHVLKRTQTEAVTFLGHPDNSKSVYSIKGLDYVAHDDILPYTSYEERPIHHDLHGKLFKYNPDAIDSTSRYVPADLLDSWRDKHPWLALSRVYKETTENIRVTVIPFYLGHTTIENTSFHWWRYCVRLENLGDVGVYLRERHWKIFSQTNMLQTIKGRGVVGVEPQLTKNEPSYQYSSHVNLQDKSGHMWGTYKMQREDGYTFDCRIPPFSLESSLENSQTSTIN